MKKIKDQSQDAQNRMFSEKLHHMYERSKHTVMPHGRHIYARSSDMAKATMCAYPQYDHALTHWKCVLRCCANCTCINITDQETDKKMKK